MKYLFLYQQNSSPRLVYHTGGPEVLSSPELQKQRIEHYKKEVEWRNLEEGIENIKTPEDVQKIESFNYLESFKKLGTILSQNIEEFKDTAIEKAEKLFNDFLEKFDSTEAVDLQKVEAFIGFLKNFGIDATVQQLFHKEGRSHIRNQFYEKMSQTTDQVRDQQISSVKTEVKSEIREHFSNENPEESLRDAERLLKFAEDEYIAIAQEVDGLQAPAGTIFEKEQFRNLPSVQKLKKAFEQDYSDKEAISKFESFMNDTEELSQNFEEFQSFLSQFEIKLDPEQVLDSQKLEEVKKTFVEKLTQKRQTLRQKMITDIKEEVKNEIFLETVVKKQKSVEIWKQEVVSHEEEVEKAEEELRKFE